MQRLGDRARGFVRSNTDDPRQFQGDLFDSASLDQALQGIDTVVHLAALTGKAPAAEHRRVNFEGTKLLLEAAQRAGVSRLIFVSTIAVTFDDLASYPYAAAKLEAEKLVQASSLRWTIVRPTMVLGEGSPIQQALTNLASAPVMPVFGGGNARVQPVDVHDLAAMLETVVDADDLDDATLTAAGPETLTMGDLLTRLRRVAKGRPGPRLRMPITPMLPFLRLGEKVALGALPFTVGQLASFRFDGCASPQDRRLVELATKNVDTIVGHDSEPLWRQEARSFSQLILGAEPPERAVDAYVRAMRIRPDLAPRDDAARRLLLAASRGRFRARMADGYARLFDPHGALRRRLVLMLAILECTPPVHRELDEPVGGSTLAALPQLIGIGLRAVAATLLGTVRFGVGRWLG